MGNSWSWESFQEVTKGRTEDKQHSITISFEEGKSITHVGSKSTAKWLEKTFLNYKAEVGNIEDLPDTLENLRKSSKVAKKGS